MNRIILVLLGISVVSAQSCAKTVTNCAKCSVQDVNICTTCNKHFYVLNGKCAGCKTAPCSDCSDATPQTCNECSDGYFMNGTVCSTCSYKTLKSKTCTGCNKKTGVCNECAANYYFPTSSKVCTACTGGTTNCTTCSSDDGGCTTCNKGSYPLKTGKCDLCTGGTGGCTACSTANSCSACSKGYKLHAAKDDGTDGYCVSGKAKSNTMTYVLVVVMLLALGAVGYNWFKYGKRSQQDDHHDDVYYQAEEHH